MGAIATLVVSLPLRAETYDAELAAKVGADEYGMKRYVMAMLMSGPNRDQTEEEAERLQRAHLDNITRLAEAGKLVLAGPFLEEGDLRGIYIFNVTSVEEAKALTQSDPAIKAGRLVMELHPWYGSAALMEVNRLHDKLAKKAI
ncbi:YciI family protein [Shewanella aquimarina]|uniref:YciI family protein n=1 Tax=Shewanella aquimarina TaxID=260365 RepID=UPI002014CACE|nr:YciI family protein [Shewanella aquimarina]MCL2909461.1 YciI family protein [Shewanella aquimarina]